MNDIDLISRQLRREMEQGEEARQRLEAYTLKAEGNCYASSTVYGQKLLKHSVGLIADRMQTTLKALGRGKGCVDAATVYNRLKAANHETLAVLALKVCLDVLGQEDKPQAQELAIPIGAAIETELRLQWYKSQDKNLFRDVTKGFHKSTGTHQKATVYRLRFNRAGLTWKSWGRVTQFKIGAWALKVIIEATGWIDREVVQHKKDQRRTIMRYSQEFLGLRDSILHKAQELAFCLWPMVCPPNDWSNEHRGGYLTEEIRSNGPMVRRVGFGPACKQGDVPIAFLNALQRQKYRLNPSVMEAADWCFEHFRSVGKFRRDTAKDRLPPFDGDPKAEKDRFDAWKRDQRKIDDHNAQLYQNNWRTTETMFVARKYADEPVFWIPWSFDYRGRVYPQCTTLNPQGTDFDKSLLYFVDEGPVNEYWLAWHVATTYGNDKLSHDDRVQWTRENTALITRIAEDPISTISEWENLNEQGKPNGEPWCFLAAAIEYHQCCIACTKTTSGLPVGIDATCSGLQHLASMTRDRVAAKEVNVVRGDEDKPSDGYKTVAQASIKYIDDPDIHPYMNRKVTKRTVMTTPYGVSRDSARDYIKKALKEEGFDLSIPGRLGKVVDAVYRHAMPEVFEGPVKVMSWLQETAVVLLQNKETIEWTTPSGFRVIQDLRHPLTKRIETMIMGSVVRAEVGNGFGKPCVQDHVGAIAPNLVHSLDASLLHLLFTDPDVDYPFTVIHDCILGRSCDISSLMDKVRLHHAEIYKGSPLEDWARQVGVELPEGLMKNTLDLDEVLDSPYFFC